MRRHPHVVPNHVVCLHCGTPFPLWRNAGHQKRAGHCKDLWCITCRAVTPHIEQPEFSESDDPSDEDLERTAHAEPLSLPSCLYAPVAAP